MRRRVLILIALGLLLAGAVVLRLMVGTDHFGPASTETVAQLRRLRVLAGIAVGVSLAVSGVMLQSLLRNPLASPDLLGLSAGAGLAVMLSAYLGYRATGSVSPSMADPLPALIGSCLALMFVYSLSQRRGFIEPVTLILVGVVVGLVCGSAGSFIRQLLPDGGFAAGRLLLGRISDDLTWPMVLGVLGVSILGAGIGAWLGPAMDASAMSDDEARSVGVPIRGLRLSLFLISGVLTAGSVVLAGPIGFVGLVVPHAARLLLGPSHRVLVLGSALLGAATIVLADSAVRAMPLGTGRLPIGVLTSLIGGPIFLAMLYSMVRRSG
ncbi:MAG TPA: iron ABC transporter permease [Phycisphaerales bacterium]|nr:iron ABC transporter permease [Phycisphaerales bacterium]